MNLRGSYTSLRNNSKAAMLAAIEIYNKPQIAYRDECFSILLVNAWELLLKAVLSKNKQRVFYPKKRTQPYKTFSVVDGLIKAKDFFPFSIQYKPVAKNINALLTYRNNAIHFYNQSGFSVIIYGLAQTSIINYRDLMLSIFNVDIANEMTISLLPLSFGTQPDPIEFLQKTKTNPPKNKAVAQFVREVSQATKELESQNMDTSRFLTVFNVNLQSVKKISSADVIVGVKGSSSEDEPLIVERRVNPNITHSLRQSDILKKIGLSLKGVKFTGFTLQAIIWKFDIKNKPNLFWRPDKGGTIQYSPEVVSFIGSLSVGELGSAIIGFKEFRRERRLRKK